MAGNYGQDVQDRAREWVNEHYPNAEGAEWDRRFEEACRELAAIDEHNDRAERAGRPPYAPVQRHSARVMADVIGRDNPAHVRTSDIEPGTQRNGRTIAEWHLASSPGNRYRGPGGESWTDGYIEYTDGAREYVIVIQGGARYSRTMAQDCTGAALAVGDRVSIDKVGEGTVSAVAGESVRIRVPGATPDEESFDPQEIRFWRVTKLSRAVSLARASGYVYELEGGGDWRTSPDDSWETVVRTIEGRVVGTRRIDGSPVVVIEQGGTYFAVLQQNVSMSRAPTAMERRRVDLGFGHTYVNDDRPVPEHGTLVAESEDGGMVEYWTYPGRGEWAYQGKRVAECTVTRAASTATPSRRFSLDDDLLDEWLDDWVLLTTGQVGLVQTVRNGQLSVDVAAGPLDHIDDAGWHTVLVPPSMVRRKLDWDEIQKLRTPEGWTPSHTPRLSSATGGAQTMARFKRGDHVQIDRGSRAGELGIVVDAFPSTAAPGGDSVTVDIADGTRVTLPEKDVSPNSPFSRTPSAAEGATTMALVKARFIDDNTAQFKKHQIVYVDENAIKRGDRHVWISEDPDGSRGAYGFAADVEVLSRAAADTARWNGATGRVVRRYEADGKAWLLVQTTAGQTLSWPAAEAQVATTMSLFKEGDRIRADSDLKQVGWTAAVKRGTTGTIVGVDPGSFGVVAYRVRWDDGQTNTLVNAHLLVSVA